MAGSRARHPLGEKLKKERNEPELIQTEAGGVMAGTGLSGQSRLKILLLGLIEQSEHRSAAGYSSLLRQRFLTWSVGFRTFGCLSAAQHGGSQNPVEPAAQTQHGPMGATGVRGGKRSFPAAVTNDCQGPTSTEAQSFSPSFRAVPAFPDRPTHADRWSPALRTQSGKPGGGKSRGVSSGTMRGRGGGQVGVCGALLLVGHGHLQEDVEVDKPD